MTQEYIIAKYGFNIHISYIIGVKKELEGVLMKERIDFFIIAKQ